MKKIKIEETLKKNFCIKKAKSLAAIGKKQLPVLVQDDNGKWIPSGRSAPSYDGQRTYTFRVVDNKLEFGFIGDPVKYLHSCLCNRAYTYEDKIILPQGLGQGYVIITL